MTKSHLWNLMTFFLYFLSFHCFADSVIVDMPLYDQTNPSLGKEWLPGGPEASMLCAPTSTAMVLATVLNHSTRSTGWVLESFTKNNWQERVTNTAKILETDPKAGTSTVSTLLFPKSHQQEIIFGRRNPSSYLAFNRGTNPFNPYTLRQVVNSRQVAVVNFGHYKQDTQLSWGHASIAFKRENGHSVALRGRNGDEILINDPWKGVLYQVPVKTFSVEDFKTGTYKNYSITAALPSGRNDDMYLSLYAAANYYAFIESYTTLSYE